MGIRFNALHDRLCQPGVNLWSHVQNLLRFHRVVLQRRLPGGICTRRPGMLARTEPKGGNAQGENINPFIGGPSTNNLWCHVQRCSSPVSWLAKFRLIRDGKTKVDQRQIFPIRRDNKVPGTDVTVDETSAVHRFNGVGHLADQRKLIALKDGSTFLNQGVEPCALKVFHQDVGNIAGGFSKLVGTNHLRVLHRDSNFALTRFFQTSKATLKGLQFFRIKEFQTENLACRNFTRQMEIRHRSRRGMPVQFESCRNIQTVWTEHLLECIKDSHRWIDSLRQQRDS